jgi:hypothetical protein
MPLGVLAPLMLELDPELVLAPEDAPLSLSDPMF